MKIRYTYYVLTILSFLYSCKYGKDSKLNILEKNVVDRDVLMDSIYSEIVFDSNTTYPYMFNEKGINYYQQFLTGLYKDRFLSGKGSLWLGNKDLTPAFFTFRNILQESRYHGLEPENYIGSQDTDITYVMRAYENNDDIPISRAIKAEKQISIAFLRFSSDLLFGKFRPDSFFSHKVWSATNDSVLNLDMALSILDNTDKDGVEFIDSLTPRHYWYKMLVNEMRNALSVAEDTSLSHEIILQKVYVMGDSSAEISPITAKLSKLYGREMQSSSPDLYDLHLDSLVRMFQISHGMEADGIINESFVDKLNEPIENQINILKYNLERWRWTAKDFDKVPNYIIVNIPAYRLFLYEEDSIVMAMNCVVGKTARQSPTIDAKMTDILLNPTWTVPPTILKKDLLPSIQRSGGYAVSRRGLTAYDRRGRQVNPGRINGSNYKNYRYVQKPSYNNSLGTIKFNMPNKEIVYIHDTNHRWGFNNKVRANSSGCVRVMHPRDMAFYFLGPDGYSREMIDSIIKTKVTTKIDLDKDVTSHFMYFTAAPDTHGVVVYYPDIYRHDTVFSKEKYLL